MNTATLPKQYEDAQDFLELWGTDYVEFYVGNAKQSAYYFKTAFGFQEVAYAGLETGVTDRTSYVLQQDKIRLVITSSLVEDSDINRHLNEHGDGVKIVAYGYQMLQRRLRKPQNAVQNRSNSHR